MLGKHSGRHALRKALEEMGFEIDGQALNTAFKRFKEIADRKKQVTAMDLEALVTDELREEHRRLRARVVRGRGLLARPPHATVSVTLPDGGAAAARSPATARSTPSSRRSTSRPAIDAQLSEFTVGAVTEGQDALGEVSVVLELDGRRAPARASRRTSSTRPRAPTCARSSLARRARGGARGRGRPSRSRERARDRSRRPSAVCTYKRP